MEGAKGRILEIWTCSMLTWVTGEHTCKTSLTYRLKVGVLLSDYTPINRIVRKEANISDQYSMVFSILYTDTHSHTPFSLQVTSPSGFCPSALTLHLREAGNSYSDMPKTLCNASDLQIRKTRASNKCLVRAFQGLQNG